MMRFGEFEKLITLDQAFNSWEGIVPGWRIRTFVEFCEFLEFTGWRII